MSNPDIKSGPASDVRLGTPPKLPPREQAWLLLVQYTTLASTFARQVTSPGGLQLGDRVLVMSDEQIAALLAAATLRPPGPHVEAAWNEIEAHFPRPQPKPEKEVT